MRRIVLAALMIAIAAGAAFAQMGDGPHRGPWGMSEGPYAQEAQAILDGYEDRVPSELTFGEREELAGELSIPAQKAAYVGVSRFASMLMPGAGQFINRDFLSGSLFALGDFTIKAGTLVGIYYLLPPEVRFDQLDYYNAPKSEIESTWETAMNNMSLADALPIVGVATGGALLNHILARFSAGHAAGLARDRIEAGEIEFEPRPRMIMMTGGRFGLGMGFAY